MGLVPHAANFLNFRKLSFCCLYFRLVAKALKFLVSDSTNALMAFVLCNRVKDFKQLTGWKVVKMNLILFILNPEGMVL